MAESARGDSGGLPLAQAGPRANGFWGTVVFVLVLATALAAVIASYFYLGGNVVDNLRGSPAARIGQPAVATALLAAGALAAAAAVRAIGRERYGALRLRLIAAFALAAAHLWLLLVAWLGSGLAPAGSARHSAFVGVAGFQAIVAAVLLVMLAVALAWAWARPADARGHATVWNAALVYGFAAVSGVVTFATLYLVPRAG